MSTGLLFGSVADRLPSQFRGPYGRECLWNEILFVA